MLVTVGVKKEFDAAHYLPNYDGKCKNMHGHTWHVTVEVTGELEPISGMVLDLAILKRVLSQAIEKFDHQLLNNYISVPTCEILSHSIASFIVIHTGVQNIIAYGGSKDTKIVEVRVTVQEGQGGYACITLPGLGR